MEMPREKWTDDRLDDLNQKVDGGFAQVDKRFDKVDARFEKVEGKIEGGVKELRDDMNVRFDKVDGRFESLNRTLLWSAVGVITTLIGCCATLAGVAGL